MKNTLFIFSLFLSCQISLAQVSGVGAGFEDISEFPTFPGCENEVEIEDKEACAEMKLLHYMHNNMTYPEEAKGKKIEGVVVAKIIVTKEGKVTQPSITQSLGGGCDEELLRLISKMPIWNPGKDGGNAIDVEYYIALKFTL